MGWRIGGGVVGEFDGDGAAIGVVFATQADIDAQYDTVIAPALSDAETIPPLTQSDIDWALDIINR